MPTNSTVTLTLGGARYQHFTALSVQRSLLQACGQMTLSYSGQSAIAPDAPFTLALDGHTALTGHIDSISASLDATALSYSAIGRDLAADLVDCSCTVQGQLNGLRLDALASHVAGGYGLSVRTEAGTALGAPFESFSIEPGESVWQVIEKACRMRALLALSDGKGALLLTRAGTKAHPSALVEGHNILRAKVTADHSQRYHLYQCLAQQGSAQVAQWSATGTVDAKDQAEASATATDSRARKPRKLAMVQEQSAGSPSLSERAAWECAVRAGKSTQLEVEVAGFSGHGALYEPNTLMQVDIPSLNLKDRLLVESVTHSLDSSGSKTTLTLVNANAYRLIPEPETKSSGGKTLEQWSRSDNQEGAKP